MEFVPGTQPILLIRRLKYEKKIIILSIVCLFLITLVIVVKNIEPNNVDDIVVGKSSNEVQKAEEKQNAQTNIKDDTLINEETYSVTYSDEDYKNLPISYSAASYAYDTSTPEKAMGIADYAFIAKINGVLRTEYRHPSTVYRNGEGQVVYDPYTVYSVEVIDNIKGEVIKTKNLEVVQHGGITSDGSQIVLMEGMELLKVGEYYILLPYTASDGRLGISSTTSIVNLGVPSESEVSTLKNIDSIKRTASSLSTSSIEDRKVGGNPIDIVTRYVEASENSVVPEGKTTIKSQIYDVELIKSEQ